MPFYADVKHFALIYLVSVTVHTLINLPLHAQFKKVLHNLICDEEKHCVHYLC